MIGAKETETKIAPSENGTVQPFLVGILQVRMSAGRKRMIAFEKSYERWGAFCNFNLRQGVSKGHSRFVIRILNYRLVPFEMQFSVVHASTSTPPVIGSISRVNFASGKSRTISFLSSAIPLDSWF